VSRGLPEVQCELDGWALWWARLERAGGGEGVPEREWEALCAAVASRFRDAPVSAHPAAREVRRLFRAAGCDPTRYRPSSEALLRRVLRGDGVPRIDPLVDLNNLLSMELVLPCCVMDVRSLEPPFTLRAGREGERMDSLRGPFDLAGKPLLEDGRGPFGTPITDSERVRVVPGTREAWLVVYRPEGVACDPGAALDRLLERFPVARVLARG